MTQELSDYVAQSIGHHCFTLQDPDPEVLSPHPLPQLANAWSPPEFEQVTVLSIFVQLPPLTETS
jgi:hypothetical protein